MKRRIAFAVLWVLWAARATASETEEPFRYPCVDAAVIATNVRPQRFPIRLPGGDKISISGVQFDVERVLYGSVNAKQLSVQLEHTYFIEDEVRDPKRRSIFFLSGAGERWELAHRDPGVVRDASGRDVYPLPEPPDFAGGQMPWLQPAYPRYVRVVTYAGGRGRPALNPAPQHAVVLDELPQVIAELRKLPCVEATEGGPAPSAAHFRAHRDYESLALVERQLRRGMPQREVEALLGTPDYSPTDGQYYYGSNQSTRDESPEHDIFLVLVVEYRDFRKGRESILTDRLQSWYLGPVGE